MCLCGQNAGSFEVRMNLYGSYAVISMSVVLSSDLTWSDAVVNNALEILYCTTRTHSRAASLRQLSFLYRRL